ncbi:MAG: TonB-dependent receptor [Terriglobia bacterium]|nr:MAG: TonB-dependent receptor [Terriglobia bacterium]
MSNTNSRLLLFAFFAVALAIASGSLFGQAFYGSVVGTITDPSSAALRGATVALTNVATGERRQTMSGSGGEYQFLNLVPGMYRVEVEQAGFKKATRENIEVNVSGTVRADMAMEIGAATQTVEVEATAPLLKTEDANLSQVVTTRAVEELPVNGRNLLNLAALVPGVVPQGTTSGNAITGKNIFAAGNYQIGGGMANQGAVYYDGVPANSALGNLVNMVPSPDAISEFRVQTNSNNAEYGRYSGGVINISSKSGSNQFHGSAYEYFRNTKLNANNFFSNATGQGRTPFHQNQYGLTGSGPIKKNRLFFFVGWEGFRSRQGNNYFGTVPLPEMYTGDFSGYKNASGAVIPIYDPLTQCGTGNNALCPGGVEAAAYSAGPARQPFPNNIIPASRFNSVAAKILAFPLEALPNQPGQAFTHLLNYSTTCTLGGNNDQENSRFDYAASDRLRVFGRYSRWHSENVPCAPMHNGIYANDPYAPEQFTTTQAVAGVTYLLTPSMILDVRASYVRFPYIRAESFENISLSKTFGFPAYMDQQIPVIHSGPGTSIPSFGISGYTTASGLHILSSEDDYLLTPNLSWIKGKHTLKFGADWRDMQNGYYQTFDGGTFNFTNNITAQNGLNPGASGNALASMLLGFGGPINGSSGSETAFSRPWESLHYQGYYGQDTWQATPRLTVTAGVRWEIPGVWRERYNRVASFDPHELNPALTGIQVNGQPIYGAVDFANTSQMPHEGMMREHFRLISPRLGIAYRLNDKTVIRSAGGIYYLPSNLQFSVAPWAQTINSYGTQWLATVDGGVTPYSSLSDPFPNGFISTPGNQPHDRAQSLLVGGGLGNIPLGFLRYPYQEQWNFTVQRQLPGGAALEVAYAGSKGVHLPTGGLQADFLPRQYLSLGSALNNQVPNPFYGLVKTGTLSAPTVTQAQLLLPFPEYTSVSEAYADVFDSTYHALQMKVEKRFTNGGTVLAAYTFSKLMSDVASLTGWLDQNAGSPGYLTSLQDPGNLRAEKALATFDSRSRLVLSYAIDLPFGPGHKFLNGANGFEKRLVGGWSASGISTFQEGLPIALTATGTAMGPGYGRRPNVVPGCQKTTSGPAQSRLNNWFNVSCFTVPAAYTLGNESATDPVLRTAGINNFDFSLLKKTPINERFNLEFRGEIFNVFNRVQFGPPNNSVTTAANPTTGFVTTQVNQPRLVQLALRLLF